MSKKSDVLGKFLSAVALLPQEVLGTLVDLCERLGGNDGKLWLERLKLFLRGEPQVVPRVKREKTSVGFKVVVDHSFSRAEMIDAGKYDHVDSDITADHFPVTGIGKLKLTMKLVNFDRAIDSTQVIGELDERDCRSATMDELLAFGSTYPKLQRQLTIAALGSSAQLGAFCKVGCLGGDETCRALDLAQWDGHWGAHFHFLAVPKSLGA